jgi:hypothetical protein
MSFLDPGFQWGLATETSVGRAVVLALQPGMEAHVQVGEALQ